MARNDAGLTGRNSGRTTGDCRVRRPARRRRAKRGEPPLPGVPVRRAGPLDHYGIWAILLLVLLEDFGIPVPGETGLIAGAIYAGSGRLNIVAVGVTGFFAAVVGDNIGYSIGRFGGRVLVLRWGKYVFLTEHTWTRRSASSTSTAASSSRSARFIEGLRQAQRDHRRHHRDALAHVHHLQRDRRRALGRHLGERRLLRRPAHHHDLRRHHQVLVYAVIAAAVALAVWIGLRVRAARKRRAAGGAGEQVEPQASDRS